MKVNMESHLEDSCKARYQSVKSIETKLSHRQIERVWEHAQFISKALNLFRETAAEIVADILRGRTDSLNELTTPECHHQKGSSKCVHQFPAWFLREAKIGRDIAALLRYAERA